MKSIYRILKTFLNPKLAFTLIAYGSGGYFFEIGWVASFINKKPVDKSGKALPWVTYPFIDFISDRLNRGMKLFEYGSGNSTIFYAERVGSITSVEHDKGWYEHVNKQLPRNATLIYESFSKGSNYYSTAFTQLEKFDIIIVDGVDRVNCIISSVGVLAIDGVIVLDDSEREIYDEAIDFLNEKGFKRLDFWGISPGFFYKKCTSIFYRKDNCLSL